MPHPLETGAASILIVEPMMARRSMLLEGFRAIGFKNLHWAASLKDAIGVIAGEQKPIDWLLTPLLAEAPINALQFMTRMLEDEKLRSMRISLILQEEEEYCLSAAFALGLFSMHARHPETQNQMAELTDILAVGPDSDWDDCLISSHYLRKHLKDKGNHAALNELDMRILSMYPDRADQALNLAEALMLTGHFGGAQMVLDRLPAMNEQRTRRAKVMIENVQTALLKSPADASAFAELMHIHRVLVVDSDSSARNTTVKALHDLGVTAVDECSDGEAAWALMKAKETTPDLVIQEWRIPKLSGDMLVQRARLNGLAGVPMIIYSSLVKPGDRLLLREMGVTEVLEKPMSAERLAASLMAILREEQRPTTKLSVERQLRACLANRDFSGARTLLARLGPNDNMRLALEAELEFQQNNLPKAQILATQALTVGGEDVMVLNLLGKIYLKQGFASQAARFLDRAQKLSPQNISRLLFLAEAHLGLDAGPAALASIAKAKALDSGNMRIIESEAKVALATGDTAGARGLIAQVGGTPGIAAFVNNRAVVLVSQGRLKESIELYRSALGSLPPKARKVRAIVGYNLALALLRSGDTAGADQALRDTPLPTDPAIKAKLVSLTTRTARAMATGEPVQLNLDAGGDALELRADDDEAARPAVEAGKLRCYGLFVDEAPDTRTVKLLAVTVGYRAGKTIRKGS